MKDKTPAIVVSKRNKDSLYYFLLIVGAFMFLLSCLVDNSPYRSIQYYYIDLLAKIFVGVSGLLTTYRMLSVDTLRVYNDRLEVTSFFGEVKKIDRSEIISWNEIVKTSRYGNVIWLILQTKNSKYKIHEVDYENYSIIRNEITNGILEGRENQSDFDQKQSRLDTITIVVAILFILSIVIFQRINK